MADPMKGSLRSLDSFGVSGVLEEDAVVYYTALFNTRQIGRVSDLITVRLNPSLDDELKLRTLLIFGTFQAFRAQFQAKQKEGNPTHSNESDLEQPLLIEVGTDARSLAISVGFDLKKGVEIDFRNISNRIASGQPQNIFEHLLAALYSYCDYLLLRYQESTRRIEVVSTIARNAGIGGTQNNVKERPQIVMLSQFMLSQAPKPRAYVDLGDLDFVALLKEGELGNGKRGIDSQGRKVKSQQADFGQGGAEREIEDQELEDEVDQEKVGGQDNGANSSNDRKRNEIDSGNEVIKVSGKDDPESNSRGGITNMLGVSGKEGSSESEARKLILEIQAGRLDRVLQLGEKDFQAFRKDIINPEAIKFIESLVEEVRKAKEQLAETARRLDYSIRVRESSLKNENNALQKELKRKENSIVQKNQEVLKLKQELVEANKQIDRLKKGKETPVESEGVKTKNPESDRILVQLKEENRALTQRYEAIQGQLNGLQLSKNAALERLNEKLEAAKQKIGIFHKKEQEHNRYVSKLLAELKSLKKNASNQNENRIQQSGPDSAGESKPVAKPGFGQNAKKDIKKAS